MAIQITILGLRRIGTSIGLALAKIKDQAVRVGNDREPGIARQAEKLGAVDKTVVNLHAAVEKADVVILAMPVDEIRETLEIIAEDLKPGVVLIDTSPVKGAVAQWAKELLPGEDRYFVGLTPSLNPAYLLESGDGPETAHADLFKNGPMLINSLPGIDESALTLATNLSRILEATPLFADAVEADGLMAYSHLLPRLVSAALVNATIDQPGWREARKMAGPAYAQATEPALYAEEKLALGQAVLLNRENTVRMLDQMMIELRQMRALIAENDAAALQERLERAKSGREQWWSDRLRADYEIKTNNTDAVPSAGEMIGRLFGVRPRRDKK